MVTGASTADLALLLVDARAGLTEQSRRHATIAALLGSRHVIVAVNKMDLVDYAEEPSTMSSARSRAGREGRPARDRVHPDLTRSTATTSSSLGEHALVYGPPAARALGDDADRAAGRPRRPAAGAARAARRRRDALGRGPARRGRAEGRRRGRRVAERNPDARRRGARRRGPRRAGGGAAERVRAPRGRDRPRARRAARGRRRRARPGRELDATVCWLGDRRPQPDRYLLKHTTRTVPGARSTHRRPDRVRDARSAGPGSCG